MTRKYQYHGPTDSSVTLRVDGRDVDVLLFRGSTVELPQTHDYVQTLIALGHLVPVDEPTAPAKPTTQKKGAE